MDSPLGRCSSPGAGSADGNGLALLVDQRELRPVELTDLDLVVEVDRVAAPAEADDDEDAASGPGRHARQVLRRLDPVLPAELERVTTSGHGSRPYQSA